MNHTIERYKSLLGHFQNNDFKELLEVFGIENTGRKLHLQEQAINLLINTPKGFDCQGYLSKIVEIYSKRNDISRNNNNKTHTMQFPRKPTHKTQLGLKYFLQKNIAGNRDLLDGYRQSVLSNIVSHVPINKYFRNTALMEPIRSENNAVISGSKMKVKQKRKLFSMHVPQQINYQTSKQPKQLISKIRSKSPQVISQKQKDLHSNNIIGNSSIHHGHQQFVTCNNVSRVSTNQQIRTTAPMDPIKSENNVITSGYNIKVEQQQNLSSMHVPQQINDQPSQQPKQLMHKIRPRSPQVMSQKQKALLDNNLVENSSPQQGQWQPIIFNVVSLNPAYQHMNTTTPMNSIGSENNAVTPGYNIKVKQQ